MRIIAVVLLCACTALGQSIGAGTVSGKVTDQSGAVIVGAVVSLQNSATNYHQTVRTDENGAYRINNVPLNSYRLLIAAPGFSNFNQDLTIRSTVPMTQDATLQIEGPQTTTVDVTATSPIKRPV